MLTDRCTSQLNDRNNDFPFHDERTDSEDCNVACTEMGVFLATGASLSASEIRKLGRTPNGPTGNTLARRVFIARGLRPGTDFQTFRNAEVQTVRDYLQSAWAVTTYIDYGYLQQHAPELTGDEDYTGFHAVMLFDFWRRAGVGRMAHVSDPTFDGRTRGNWTAPKGVQSAPFPLYRDAAGLYGKAGTMTGWAIKPKEG